MIEVDMDETRQLLIIADGVGTRTTLTIPHQDGFELLKQLTEYYGRLEFGHSDETPTKQGLMARLLKRFTRG